VRIKRNGSRPSTQGPAEHFTGRGVSITARSLIEEKVSDGQYTTAATAE
jgi:hypothetical protein